MRYLDIFAAALALYTAELTAGVRQPMADAVADLL
jgi:hypothetical protein